MRLIALSLAAWVASFSAWWAVREIRWRYWRERCGRAEVERDHWRREASWWKAQAEFNSCEIAAEVNDAAGKGGL